MKEKTRKCVNPECNCPAPTGGDYCSDYCQDPSMANHPDFDQPLDTGEKLICYCDHPECQERSEDLFE